MKDRRIKCRTSIQINESYEGESIETKVQRIINNKEPIKDGAPIIHMRREEGVLAGCDPRTDRFEIAVEAMGKIERSISAQRQSKIVSIDKNDKNDVGSDQTTKSMDAKGT